MKKETLADRLNEAMASAGMSQGALAKASGIAQPTIWRLVSGNARGSTKIVEIANALGVRSEWLSTGNGPMRDDGQPPRAAQAKSQDTDAFRIDVLDLMVSAGPGIVNQEFVEILRSVEYEPAEARHMFDGRKAENIRIDQHIVLTRRAFIIDSHRATTVDDGAVVHDGAQFRGD